MFNASCRSVCGFEGAGSLRLSFFGDGGLGGIVEAGLGDVSAKTRAAAMESANMLNSAKGVIFPGL